MGQLFDLISYIKKTKPLHLTTTFKNHISVEYFKQDILIKSDREQYIQYVYIFSYKGHVVSECCEVKYRNIRKYITYDRYDGLPLELQSMTIEEAQLVYQLNNILSEIFHIPEERLNSSYHAGLK